MHKYLHPQIIDPRFRFFQSSFAIVLVVFLMDGVLLVVCLSAAPVLLARSERVGEGLPVLPVLALRITFEAVVDVFIGVDAGVTFFFFFNCFINYFFYIAWWIGSKGWSVGFTIRVRYFYSSYIFYSCTN